MIHFVPNPTRGDFLGIDEAIARRRIGCASERDCLDVAARAGWPALSCEACRAYRPLPREQRCADAGPLLALRLAIELPTAKSLDVLGLLR